MNIDISHLPNSLRSEPPARRAAFAMLFSLGDCLDWSQDSAGLEIAGLERPGESARQTLPVAMLGPQSDLQDWRDSLRIGAGMNRREPAAGRGGINILVRPAPRVDHPWVLLDDLNSSRAVALCHQHGGIAVETSVGNAQAWLRLDACLRHIDRTTVAQALAQRLGGDPSAANGSQFGRLAGFRQRKAGKAGWTNIIADTSRTLLPWPSSSLLSLTAICDARISGVAPPCPTVVVPSLSNSPDPAGPQAPIGGRRDGRDGDESAKEFAFACHRLRAGWTPERVEQSITEHAISRGKRQNRVAAEKYAHHTVQRALQSVGAHS